MALAILQSSQPVPVVASHSGSTLGTLPDTSPPIAEQRRTDSHVCRAGRNCRLQVTAHPGRNHRGGRPDGAHGRGVVAQPGEGVSGRHAERGDGHHARQDQPRLGHQGLGQPRNLAGRGPAARGIAVQADLDQALDDPPGPAGARAERVDQPQPVDRVHEGGVAHDAGGLVGLQLADEVPDEIEVGALRGLWRRFRVTVLPEIGNAEPAQQPDVGSGEGLGHRDERDVLGLTARGLARGGNAFAHRGEPHGEVFPPRRISHLRKSGTSRSSSSSKTTGRRRVLATSKVLPSLSSASEDAPGAWSLAQRRASGAGGGGGAAGGAGALPEPAAELLNPGFGAELAGLVPNSKPPNEEVLLNAVPPDSALPLPARPLRFSSRPAAMTVTLTSSPRASSMTAPKMMFASTAAELETS